MFDDQALEALKQAQAQELTTALDGQHRASLAIEHKQQLQYAREAKIGRTIEDYLAYPYVKIFATRHQATQGRQKIQSYINASRKKLEDHRDK